MEEPAADHDRLVHVRTVTNWINLSTPLGLALAAAGRCRIGRGPRGLWLAEGYRWGFPIAGAFTVGSVVITGGRFDEMTVRLPRLLAHEERHATQWSAWLGLPMLPAYLVAMAWSWLRTGDLASANAFEVRAGLADGGYREAVPGRPFRRRAERSR
ncbi:hypothetical protein [Raineyella sp. LH-20]|uniref:hypothetical protein n=1 Tax=Raineyella sp. LH-20 TaxID=3081204 RepID=UPI0029533507|nr:hypothetical protein [Raineyella sp. LH-20]WOP17323.1 hypothetical protein R0146_08495 [Raineyella sp. LH-20]